MVDHPYLGGVILCLSTPWVFSYKASSSAVEAFEQETEVMPTKVMATISVKALFKCFIVNW